MVNRPLPTPQPNVNQVASLLAGPCAVPVFAIVGLFEFDALTAFWSIVSPNWKDTIKEGPGRKSWLHQLEVTLDGAEGEDPAWFIQYLEKSYVAFEFLDIFAFWFMVGYALTKGLLDWTSMIYRMSPCFPKREEFYIDSKTPDGIWEGEAGDYQLGPIWFDLHTNTANSEFAPEFSLPKNASGNIAIMVQYYNIVTNEPAPMDVRITDGGTGVYWESLYKPEKKHDAHLSSGLVELGFTTGSEDRTYVIEVRAAGTPGLVLGTAGGHFHLDYTLFE